MSNSPYISVIIPVYNRISELRRSIRSVLLQTYSDFELIVVDDGSTGSFKGEVARIVHEFNDSRVRLIRLNNNKNGAFARNIGARSAKGKYLSFLDSDDEWMSNKLATITDYIRENSDSYFIYHQYVNAKGNEQSSPIPRRGIGLKESFCDYSFVTNRFGGIQSSCITVLKDLFFSILFNESLSKHQDWDFVMRLHAEYPHLSFIEEPFTIRHIEPTGFGMVSQTLGYRYSYDFLEDRANYFSVRSLSGYALNILLPMYFKQLYFSPGPCPRFRPLLLMALLSPLSALSLAYWWRGVARRCKRLWITCCALDVKRLGLYGYNTYTKLFLAKYGERFDEVLIIDKNVRACNCVVTVKSLSSYRAEELQKVDQFVAMTDRYYEEMSSAIADRLGDGTRLIKF